MSFGTPNNLLQPNFAEVELVNSEIAVYRTDYSKELFDECMTDDKKNYFYYRDGKHLYAIPQSEAMERPIGFNTVIIDHHSEPKVVSNIDLSPELIPIP